MGWTKLGNLKLRGNYSQLPQDLVPMIMCVTSSATWKTRACSSQYLLCYWFLFQDFLCLEIKNTSWWTFLLLLIHCIEFVVLPLFHVFYPRQCWGISNPIQPCFDKVAFSWGWLSLLLFPIFLYVNATKIEGVFMASLFHFCWSNTPLWFPYWEYVSPVSPNKYPMIYSAPDL